MEQEHPQRGRSFTFGDFVNALYDRGKNVQAREYEQKFSRVFCPPMTNEQLLTIPFNDLCDALTLLKSMPLFSTNHPRVFPKLLENGQTRRGSNFRYGTWYLNKMRKDDQ